MASIHRFNFLTWQHCQMSLVKRLLSKIAMESRRARGTSPSGHDSYKSRKLIYPAATRNREPILNILKAEIPKYFAGRENIKVLEIASGSGQHTAFFAPSFPNATFQPSEFAAELLDSISIYAAECPTRNIKAPVQIDIRKDMADIGLGTFDVIYCANMIHISPYDCTVGLFMNASSHLSKGGLLITYGPYAVDGILTPESNVSFDRSLRSQNPEWGVRCLTELTELGKRNEIELKTVHEMPANNKCVIWQRL